MPNDAPLGEFPEGSMGDALSVRRAPSASRRELEELLRPTLQRTAVAALCAGSLWLVVSFIQEDPEPGWVALLPAACMLAGASLGLLRSAQYDVACASLVGGLWLASAMANMVGNAAAPHVALACALVAGVLAGPRWSALSGLSLPAAGLLGPGGAGWALTTLWEAGLGVFLSYALGGAIARSLLSAQASELQAWEFAREASRRRGELQRTAKALRDAYALLERTNRELELARREAEEAKEMKARFAANISHELRTPLNLIMGFSYAMYATPEVYGPMEWPAELRLDIHEIYTASRHLLGMIDDILDLSRIEAQRLPLKLEPTDMAELIEQAASTARGLLRGSEVQLVVALPESLPQVVVDRTRIRQVLLNLFSNAIRFTERGEIRVSARAVGGELEIAVADTGEGIPPEDLPAIFEEFSQARGPITTGKGGAGLGLAVCREFVRLHGGRIWAESELGKGSTFRFTLPLPASGKARSRTVYYLPDGWSPPLPKERSGRAVVVLAPDEPSARQVARGISGYRILIASSVEELPALVEQEHPAGVLLVKDPLATAEGPRPEDIWRATGRQDLGVLEFYTPLESLARRYLQVDAYLVKPVQAEELVVALDGVQAPGRFLVVDDDAGFRALMQRLLQASFPGAAVQLCPDGEGALALLRQEPFDVVILDLLMPGMNGVELLMRAREQGLLRSARVIVTTGASYPEELGKVFPTWLTFSKRARPRGSEWFRCIKALFDEAPPDYSLAPAAPAQQEGIRR
jgi:signal transduction histidine kinase/CheY-like chemotaxis protein